MMNIYDGYYNALDYLKGMDTSPFTLTVDHLPVYTTLTNIPNTISYSLTGDLEDLANAVEVREAEVVIIFKNKKFKIIKNKNGNTGDLSTHKVFELFQELIKE